MTLMNMTPNGLFLSAATPKGSGVQCRWKKIRNYSAETTCKFAI